MFYLPSLSTRDEKNKIRVDSILQVSCQLLSSVRRSVIRIVTGVGFVIFGRHIRRDSTGNGKLRVTLGAKVIMDDAVVGRDVVGVGGGRGRRRNDICRRRVYGQRRRV